MDAAIKLITPELMRELGAEAFDQGRGVDDHNMNPGAPARKDWQAGWHQRRIQLQKEQAWAEHEPAGANPP